MSKIFLLAVYVIIGSFILSFIIAPLTAVFSIKKALLMYVVSWIILFAGILLGGKCAYDHCTKKLKKMFKR